MMSRRGLAATLSALFASIPTSVFGSRIASDNGYYRNEFRPAETSLQQARAEVAAWLTEIEHVKDRRDQLWMDVIYDAVVEEVGQVIALKQSPTKEAIAQGVVDRARLIMGIPE